MIEFKVGEKEVAERAKQLIDEWSKELNRLNKKKLGVLKELFTKKRIADEAGLPEWKWHILWLKLEQLESIQNPSEVGEVLLQAKAGKTYRIPIHSKYWLIEEECLFWSVQSLVEPLSHESFKRYMSVFEQLCKKYNLENPLKEEIA